MHVLIVLLLLLSSVNANCIWYGIGEHTIPGHPHYAAYDGPAKPLDDKEAFATLSKLCPTLTAGDNPRFCCDKAQVDFFSGPLGAASMLLHRCPACWSNFRQLLCAMTCAPDQSDFLTPLVVGNLVLSIQYNITDLVGSRFYNSCKDVQFAGGHAIDPICGSNCSMLKLLDAIGNGPQSPFPIGFNVLPANTSQPVFNASFYSCADAVPPLSADPGGPACACADCESACIPPEIPPEKPWPTIFGIDAWWVGSFIALMVLVLMFSTFEFVTRIYHHRRRRSSVQPTTEQPIPLEQTSRLGSLQAKLEAHMYHGFSTLGRFVAGHPYLILLASVVISAVLSCGLVFFTVTTNPVELWSGPRSRSRLEKDHFDRNFVPFYRTEQLIISPKNQTPFEHNNLYPGSGQSLFGAALEKNFLLEVMRLQTELRDLVVPAPDLRRNITLTDLCFKPLSPDNLDCAITSPLEYFQSDLDKFNFVRTNDVDPDIIEADYLDHLLYCARSPLSVTGSTLNASFSCLGSSGMPIQPNLAFGGFTDANYWNASSVVLTFVVNNHPDPHSDYVRLAERWEAEYLKHIRAWADRHGDLAEVSYQAERSVEDEINRQSNADVFTVLLSYVVMFLYVSIFLASYRGWRTLFVDLRVTLGLGGILIVIISVVASVGLWSYAGYPATLIIVEVIPFLVLAVGVDNIFILVHDFEFDDEDAARLLRARAERLLAKQTARSNGESSVDLLHELGPSVQSLIQARVSRTLGRVGPSLLLSSSAEAVAFFCGSLTTMPAVRAFALYAGMAIVFNFLLQIFAFVALLTLDARRRVANRFDVFCCCRLRTDLPSPATSSGDAQRNNDTDSLSLDSKAWENHATGAPVPNGTAHSTTSGSWLHQLVANLFTPFILSGWVRPIVIVISLVWACFCVAIIPRNLHIGLDQRLAMPEDSYVLRYFNKLASDLRVGPPVYFVLTAGHDYTEKPGQDAVCSSVGCPQTSLTGRITEASRIANYSGVAQPASSWIDDYFDWINPESSPLCCRVYTTNTSRFCPPGEKADLCQPCPVRLVNNRPTKADFMTYLDGFLSQNPDENCAKAGRAAYKVAVNVTNSGHTIGPTYFMTYHTVLSDPDDYLNAIRGSRRLADEINRAWHANDSSYSTDKVLAPNTVYPYSVFYVYYEQYLTVSKEAAIQLTICMAAITVVTFILLGLNFAATCMVIFGLLYIIVSMLGLMVLWSIDLNAISLVNLVVTVGIGVEFCAHMVRAFTVSVEPTRLGRAKYALTDMGSSILRGITLTKLGGIVVLGFSKSRLFTTFYFRMYLGIILFGAYTGLVLLPVVMSYFGPSLNKVLARKHMERLPEQTEPETDPWRAETQSAVPH